MNNRHFVFIVKGLLALVILITADIVNGQPDDSLQKRRAAAESYLAFSPVEEMYTDMIAKVALEVPTSDRASFTELMKAALRTDHIEPIILDALVKTFTAREIDAMARFNGSPEGKAIQRKMGDYMATIMPAVQAELMRAFQEVETTHKNKTKSAKGTN